MSRTERLFDLMQILRTHRRPVSGNQLAAQLGVSIRTLYRDIQLLKGQGASVDGEPGLGYVLRPGFMLPPLMFSEEELEAIVLGARWVSKRGDKQLAFAARNALAKIGAVLPAELRLAFESVSLLVGPSKSNTGGADLASLREALRLERKLRVGYLDAAQKTTQRIIWPCAIAFFDEVQMVVGWCELRKSFRHFRIDRIQQLTMLQERYPRRRQSLLKEWRSAEKIPE